MIEKSFQCVDCQHEWSVAFGKGRPDACPQCNGTNLQRSEKDRGKARRGRGKGRCGRSMS